MRRKRKNTSENPKNVPSKRQGFDFGMLQRSSVANEDDFKFNQDLIESEVIGCAYGLGPVEGAQNLVPFLSLIVLNEDKVRSAFESFRAWGCEDDGDVVSAEIVLRNDGSYRLAMGPDILRRMYKTTHYHQLLSPLFFGVTWIKTVDSTNPILREWANRSKSHFTPIRIDAVTSTGGARIPTPDAIQPISGLPQVIKFGLRVLHERDHPDHWLIRFTDGKKPKSAPPEATPITIALSRKKVISVAFPVSRNRILRAGLVTSVRALSGIGSATEAQIVQAAINLLLSRELCGGRLHYEGLSELDRVVWPHIVNRLERADGETLPALLPEDVGNQLKLDVAKLLSARGVPTHNLKFDAQQQLFLRRGYGGS